MKDALLLFAAVVVATALPRPATALSVEGVSPNGAAYTISLPDGWQPGNGLVLVQHGFRFVPEAPTLGPSSQAILADGFAIAASGYHQTGWTVGAAVDDNVELLALFRAQFGDPGHVVTHGGSMGGLIALKLAEDERVRDTIDGVVALCPAVDGVGTWDRAFDLRVAYDALCSDVSGGQLPVGDAPTGWASNLDVLAQAPTSGLDFPATIRALPPVQACLALHVPAAQRSPAATMRLAALLAIAGTQDEDHFAAMMNYAFFGLADLLRKSDKLNGHNPFYNRFESGSQQPRDFGYVAAIPQLPSGFDAGVARVPRDAAARLAFHRDSSLDGSAATRIVSIHTEGDGIVPARQQRLLQQRMGWSRVLSGVTHESTPTHCGFSQGEYDAAWDTLHDWLMSSVEAAPDLAALQAHCVTRNVGPCRFDATATAIALAEPAPELRPALTDPLDVRDRSISGLWWDPARPAQGILIEELDDYVGHWREGEQRVAVSWYTWAPQADPQPGPRWFYGVGRAYESGVVVEMMLELRNGRFGSALDPTQVERVAWGRIELTFAGGHAMLHYDAQAPYGRGSVPLAQLTLAGTGRIPHVMDDASTRTVDVGRSGTYFDPEHAVGGWMLNQQVSDDPAARVGSLAVWFTWDPNGRPLWMYGSDADAADGVRLPMQRPMSGGRFEPGYAQEAVRFDAWGDVSMTGCVDTSVDRIAWTARTHGYGDGDVPVARLTRPTLADVAPCP